MGFWSAIEKASSVAKSFGSGVKDMAVDTIDGLKTLGTKTKDVIIATGNAAVTLATDHGAREELWNETVAAADSVRSYAESVSDNPARLIVDAQDALNSASELAAKGYDSTVRAVDAAVTNLMTKHAEAVKAGREGEFWAYGVGYGIGEIGSLLTGGAGALGKAGKVAKIADKAEDILDIADDVATLQRKADRLEDAVPNCITKCPATTKRVTALATGEKVVDGVPISQATSAIKGNFGEYIADADAAARGWSKLNGPHIKIGDPIKKGIDGVYQNAAPPPPFIVADAKFGGAQLATLKDGTRQMSQKWIQDRLRDAVGDKLAKKITAEGYSRVVQRVDEFGNVTLEYLE